MNDMQSTAQFRRVVLALALISLVTLSIPLAAETRRDMRGDESIDYWSRYGQVNLEFERVQFRAGEDIPLKFRVRNVGYQVIRIYPSSRPISTYRFLVTDRQGRELPVRFNQRS
ncbi:MAG: hypothetical protein RIF32_16975, partial [Leptospirales bacterium]